MGHCTEHNSLIYIKLVLSSLWARSFSLHLVNKLTWAQNCITWDFKGHLHKQMQACLWDILWSSKFMYKLGSLDATKGQVFMYASNTGKILIVDRHTEWLGFICREMNVWMYVHKPLIAFHLLPKSRNLTPQRIPLNVMISEKISLKAVSQWLSIC